MATLWACVTSSPSGVCGPYDSYAAPGASIGEVDGVWEICSTGGVPETFRVSRYSIKAARA